MKIAMIEHLCYECGRSKLIVPEDGVIELKQYLCTDCGVLMIDRRVTETDVSKIKDQKQPDVGLQKQSTADQFV